MQYELVNVTGVRETPFTAELIVPADEEFDGVVGLFEDAEEGNIAPGLSLFNVSASQYVQTGEFIDRFPLPDEPRYTPQLV